MRVDVVLTVLGLALMAGEVSAEPRGGARGSTAGAFASQKSIRFGAHASYANESDLGVGARALWSVSGLRRLAVVTSFDYFFPSGSEGVVSVDARHWEVNGNFAYHFGSRWRPYAGPGLNLARRSAELAFLGAPSGSARETALGVNLVGGVRRVNGTKRQYFAEARYEVGGGEQFLLAAGVLF
jgi:hypothetical protein